MVNKILKWQGTVKRAAIVWIAAPLNEQRRFDCYARQPEIGSLRAVVILLFHAGLNIHIYKIVSDTIMANKAINMSGAYQLYIRQNSIPRSQLVRDADWLECYPIIVKPFRDIFDSRNLEKQWRWSSFYLWTGSSWEFVGKGENRCHPPPFLLFCLFLFDFFLYRRLGLLRLISPWVKHTVLQCK